MAGYSSFDEKACYCLLSAVLKRKNRMTQWVQPLVDYLTQNPGMAWAIAFLVAMGEALFVVGLVVPSTAVLVAIGTLVGLGKLSFWPVFAMTVLGAIVGDALSFWFGHVYKERVKTMWPFSNYPHALDRGVEFIKKHGGKSIFVGRFVPGVKAVVPGLAGMMGMDVWHFTWINVVSGIAWAAAHLMPAVLAGAALSIMGTISTRLMIFGVVVIVVALLAGFIVKWSMLLLSPRIDRYRYTFARWATSHRHPVINWFGRTFDPDHAHPLTMLTSAVVLAIGLPMFIFIVNELGAKEPLVLADSSLSNFAQGLRTGPIDTVLMAITMLGDGVVLIPVIAAALAWLAYKRDWLHALGLFAATASASLFVTLIKYGVHRQRPTAIYEGISSLSFPSGHATNNAVAYAILAYLIAHALPRWQQGIVYFVAAFFIVLIALSRVYLGAHWPSDVAAGLFFGFAMAALFTLLLGRHPKKSGGYQLAAVVLSGLLVFGSWNVTKNWTRAQTMYAQTTPPQQLSTQDWMQSGWTKLAARRIDLIGETEEPFVLQIAGNEQEISQQLMAQGWSESKPFQLAQAFVLLSPAKSLQSVPPLPVLHDGRPAALSFTRSVPANTNQRFVLRLWKSPFVLSGGSTDPLLIGSIVLEELKTPYNAVTVVAVNDGFVPSAAQLPRFTPEDRTVTRKITLNGSDREITVLLSVLPHSIP